MTNEEAKRRGRMLMIAGAYPTLGSEAESLADAILTALTAPGEDTARLDWLEQRANGLHLLSDDGEYWTLSESGFQPVPPLDGPHTEPFSSTAMVMPDEWRKTVREAIDAVRLDSALDAPPAREETRATDDEMILDFVRSANVAQPGTASAPEEFKVGDRVLLPGTGDDVEGTVKDVRGDRVGVRWDGTSVDMRYSAYQLAPAPPAREESVLDRARNELEAYAIERDKERAQEKTPASAPEAKETTSDLYVIEVAMGQRSGRGRFERPDRAGYTNDIAEAGQWPLAELQARRGAPRMYEPPNVYGARRIVRVDMVDSPWVRGNSPTDTQSASAPEEFHPGNCIVCGRDLSTTTWSEVIPAQRRCRPACKSAPEGDGA